MIQRIYIDTSVIGGCFDNEFANYSTRLFEEFASGDKKLIISDIVLLELEEAPPEVRDVLNKIHKDNTDYVFLSQESTALANTYLKEGVIAGKSFMDARPIATVERVDVLVSWNFKHIVNLNRIHLINSVNLKLGYPILEIRSPMEVIYGS
jgi:hypothetical protein